LDGAITIEIIIKELDKYLNEYHVNIDAAVRGIVRKYRNPDFFSNGSDRPNNIIEDG